MSYEYSEHGPYCHRMECPGCIDDYIPPLPKYKFHIALKPPIIKEYKNTETAIANRPVDCIYITDVEWHGYDAFKSPNEYPRLYWRKDD